VGLADANRELVAETAGRERADEALRRRDAEILAARKIQEYLLPDGPPILPGFDIAGMTYPADLAAGDYFDYLSMRDGLSGFVVADVSGHGIVPAMVTATTHAYLRSLAALHAEVHEIVSHVNAILCGELQDGLFVTALLASLDPVTRTLTYAGAGHPNGYIIGSSGEVRVCLRSTGPVLGVMRDAIFPASSSVVLEPGDIVLLLTDGVTEAESPDHSWFGTERAIDIVRENLDRTADEIIASIRRGLQEFSGRDTPVDDVTVVVVKAQPVR